MQFEHHDEPPARGAGGHGTIERQLALPFVERTTWRTSVFIAECDSAYVTRKRLQLFESAGRRRWQGKSCLRRLTIERRLDLAHRGDRSVGIRSSAVVVW
jgi:hypothetical protein